MAYTKYSLTPANNTAAPPDGAPEGMLPSAVNDTMRDMMAQIRDCGDGVRDGTYTMTAVKITGGTINGATIGATTATTGKFSTLTNSALTSGRVTYAGTAGVLQDSASFVFDGSNVGLGVAAGGTTRLSVSASSGSLATFTQTGATSYGVTIVPGADTTYDAFTINNAANTLNKIRMFGNGNATFAGLVGIGTSSPGSPLTVSTTGVDRTVQINSTDGAGGYGAVLSLNNTGTGGREYYISSTSNADGGVGGGKLKFYDNVAGATRMLIDSSGNVGIGVTPSAWGGSGQVALQIGTGTSGTANFAGGGTKTLISSNQYYNGSVNKYINNGYAQAMVLDTDSSFSWIQAASGTAGNTASFFTKMTLDSSGNLLVGATAQGVANGGIQFLPAGNGASMPFVGSSGNTSSDAQITYGVYSTTAAQYQFYVGYGGTVYARSIVISSLSDARLKENIVDLDVGLDKIMALKPRKFDWKEGQGTNKKNVRGFIAQELEEVFPDLIDEWRDPAPEGEEPYRSVRQDLMPVLVKAIQEQQALIESLTTRLTALESK